MTTPRAIALATLLLTGFDCRQGGGTNTTGSGGHSATGGSSAGDAGPPNGSGGSVATASGGMAAGGGGSGGQPALPGGTGGIDSSLDGSTDAPSEARAADSEGDTQPQAPGAAFAAVLAVFKARCVACHAAGAIAPGMPHLHLTVDVAYRSLVDMPAEQACGKTLVVPSDSAKSYLFRKITDTPPCSGERMPIAYEAPFMPLGDADVAAVKTWIDQGAPP